MSEQAGFWDDAEVISSYSRAQAIEDGVLVDVTGKESREAGFKYPISMTRSAYETCVALTPAAKRAGNDIAGRLWDVMWMLKLAVRSGRGGQEIRFSVMCCTTSKRPSRVDLKALCGPGDDMEPVITIMLPDED